jgi:hypothetical protein
MPADYTSFPLGGDGIRRFSGSFPCPICGGAENDARGQGRRCHGFLSSDGRYAHCARAEHAGALPIEPRTDTYAHRLAAPCKCGHSHGAAPPAAKAPWEPPGELERSFVYKDVIDGKVVFNRKVDRYRKPDGDKAIKQNFPLLKPDGSFSRWVGRNVTGQKAILYHRPEILALPGGSIVYVVEGEPKVEAIRDAGLRATCCPGGALKWDDSMSSDLSGQHIIILADNDQRGRDHGEQVARSVAPVAASVKVVELPDLPPKGDIVDWLAAGRTIAEMEAIAAHAPPWSPPAPDRNGHAERADPLGDPATQAAEGTDDAIRGKALIRWNDRPLPSVTKDALDAIEEDNKRYPRNFRSGRDLCRLVEVDGTKPQRELHSPDSMRGQLARVALWGRARKGKPEAGLEMIAPPREVVADIMSLDHERNRAFPPLNLITDVPVFDGRGRLIQTPGYNPDSAAWYEPAPGLSIPPIPESPSRDDIERAKSLIFDELLVDFPFADQASRANAAGLMIQPFVREMVAGPTAPNLLSASQAGSGKGLLVSASAIAKTGRAVSPMGAVKDDDEWNKRIKAILLDDQDFVNIDNVNDRLDSGSLASVFTAYPTWSGRVLGASKIVHPLVRCCFCVTANNPTVSTELSRRFNLIRLEPAVENPWTRTGFKHERLLSWAIENRGQLVWAALVLVRAWIAADMPRGRITLGSYEAWSATMGGIMDTAGIEEFLANQADLYEMGDNETGPWRAFASEWWNGFGSATVGSAELYRLCQDHSLLAEALSGTKTEAGAKKRLGNLVKKRVGRVFGRLRIVRRPDDHSGTAQFALEERQEVIEA